MEYNQEFLNELVKVDSCGFLTGVSNWCNHRPLLYLALQLSQTGDILEMGCGDGSTNHLHCISEINKRYVRSYDYNQEWLDKYKFLETVNHNFDCFEDPTEMVEQCIKNGTTVCLVDHSPGERRWIDAIEMADKIPFVVIHDSELAATGYMLDRVFPYYKYRINLNTIGACACLLSNTFDVTVFDNMKLGDFLLETRIA